jgi:hypothetical protein
LHSLWFDSNGDRPPQANNLNITTPVLSFKISLYIMI